MDRDERKWMSRGVLDRERSPRADELARIVPMQAYKRALREPQR